MRLRVSWLMPATTRAQSAISSAPAAATTTVAPPREYYIDRLRSVMTALVILHHTAITYGAAGGWFYNELKPSGSVSSSLLTMFCAINQAYFMGFFFLLAGYFTPGSLERKGYRRFIGDRFLRLGLPLLVFIVVLGPLTAAIVSAAQGDSFWGTFAWLWNHQRIINGPMWFVQALLMMTLVYCGWRAIAGSPLSQTGRTPSAVPANRWWVLSALAVGIGAVAIRQVVPVGQNVFGLQLGYFASYIFLFGLGIAAWRHDWLTQLRWKNARWWIRGLGITVSALPAAMLLARSSHGGGNTSFAGGLSWTAIFYAFWEPVVAWGLIAAWLLSFRARMNQASRVWDWLGRRAYAVYIIHPLVLVGVALLLHGWVAPALIKFVVVGFLSCAVTWLVADPLVRIPGVRRVV
jgi:peptidoglycan/LPS O-acetylase OafA/YrhL